jgi:sulfatase modifying factor 1
VCINAAKDNDSCDCGSSRLNRQIKFGPYQEQYAMDKAKPAVAGVNEKKIGKMSKINGDTYSIGTNNPVFVADGEGPKREVTLSSFYIDKFEVSNKEFGAFVSATGYTTEAENFGDSFIFEGLLKQNTKDKIKQAVAQAPWWLPVKGASWQHPEGPDSNITCKYKKRKRKIKYFVFKIFEILTHQFITVES